MTTATIDRSGPIREGEELDLERLVPYLRTTLKCPDATVEIEQFPGGHSNLTYLVHIEGEEFVLRRPPYGSQVATAHDMGREFRILSRLGPAHPPAPTPRLFCEDTSILGAPFYLMERMRGVILRTDLPTGLGRDTVRTIAIALINALADLHAIVPQEIGLGEFGRPAGYVGRQVEGWIGRYEKSRTDEIPQVETVTRWMREHRPAEAGVSILHNDFKFDNVVLDPEDWTQVVGILDWEMATVACPLMDLGTMLSYWREPGDPDALLACDFGPTRTEGMLNRQELVDHYAERTGRDLSGALFYYVYGLFKTAVILQQIYYRFHHGQTDDPRFGRFGEGTRAFIDHAAEVIQRGQL